MKYINRITLIILVSIATISFAQAPVVYDYLSITYTNERVEISVNGKELLKEKVSLPKGSKSVFNVNPVFTKVKEYENLGWELLSLNSTALNHTMVYSAFMRKQIKVQAP